MTAVPPPVPPEIVEHAAKALATCDYHRRFTDDEACDSPTPRQIEDARYTLAAVYGDIVEAATTAAYDVCARQLASQRAAYEADRDRAVEAARRDALAEAIDVVEETLTYGARHHTVNALIDLRDATAPPHAPTATVETR